VERVQVSSMGVLSSSVNLIEVDVVRAEATQAVIDLRENGFARRPCPLGPGHIRPLTLVAMTTSSRETIDSRIWPVISSVLPAE
jgi:hypothetical protein